MASKKLFRRLLGLGATPLVDPGLGDDQHPSGYEAALDLWLPSLWARLRALNALPQGVDQVGIYDLIVDFLLILDVLDNT